MKDAVKERLRNPDSFEHIETVILPIDVNRRHLVAMKYRAENGFGGMNVEEAVGIIDNGTLVTEGTPQDFIKQMGTEVFQIEGSGNQEAFIERLEQLPFVQTVNTSNGTMQINAGEGSGRLVEIVQASQDSAFRIEDVSIAKPTLGDVFLKYTGRQLRDK